MTADELQAALALADNTLACGIGAERTARHAVHVMRLVDCVSALRDVLSQTERERDEAATRAYDARDAIGNLRTAAHEVLDAWAALDDGSVGPETFAAALAALREAAR